MTRAFPNILVTGDHAFPMIKKHRGAKKQKGAYYGPFASAGAVNRTLNQLQKVFLLRNCSDKRCSKPHAALPAISDQALQRPVRRSDLGGGLCRKRSATRNTS